MDFLFSCFLDLLLPGVQAAPHASPDQLLLHEPGEQQDEAQYEGQTYIEPRVLVPWQVWLADTAVPVNIN